MRDKLLIVGNWNAQIGKNSITEEDQKLIGKELGFEKCNENGEEFKMFLHIHNVINISSKIGVGTKVTWRSGRRESQIDHVNHR